MSAKKKNKWTRRAFIGTSTLAGVGLIVGVGGNAYINKKIKEYTGTGMGEGDSLNAFVRIAADNTITVAVARSEMGQGVYTSLPQLVAEELEVEMSSIRVINPQPESPYANTFMMTGTSPNTFEGYGSIMEKILAFMPIVGTGGSSSVGNAWVNMRYAGATAREMLKKAAADQWKVNVADCKAEKGHIINQKSGEKLTYGSLAEAAAKVELKGLPELKKRAQFTTIGKPVKRLDIPEKVNGTAVFGLDVRLDNMRYAAFRHPKVIGGKITSVTNEDKITAMPGVKKVLLTTDGVAVIADNTWRAMTAVNALETKEEDGGNAGISSASIAAQVDEIMDETPLKVSTTKGDTAKALAEGEGTLVEGRYDVPHLAHSCMEPLNCTVLIGDDKCEAWVGHQMNSIVKTVLSEVAGTKNVKINSTYLGGGFGRRSEGDFVHIAATIALEMKGTPVQTVFSREECTRNDMYRPAAASRFKAKVNDKGEILAWDNMMVLQSVSKSAVGRMMPAMTPKAEDDGATAEGAAHMPYAMQNQSVAFGDIDLPIRLGFWRSVGHSQNAFFVESFMDECAHAAKQDPYLFRKSKLAGYPRHEAVLDKVAEMSNWKTPLPEGRFRGIALHKSFRSIVGQVAEIEKISDKEFKLIKYYCVVDCGNVVNPDTVEAQMQGGIIFGLSAALFGEISWEGGSVVEGNFPQYEMVRLQHCPEIEVHIMDVDENPGGVGEPGTPPAAPALANALFAATGVRERRLPLVKLGYSFA